MFLVGFRVPGFLQHINIKELVVCKIIPEADRIVILQTKAGFYDNRRVIAFQGE